MKTDGRELRRPDGRAPEFAADSIALSRDGEHLYWKALTGRTLYRIPTSALEDAGISATDLEGLLERVGDVGVSDGLLMDDEGRLYVTALEENAIKRREKDGQLRTVVTDKRLRFARQLRAGSRWCDLRHHVPHPGHVLVQA